MAHAYKPGTWEVKQKDSSSKPVNTTQQDLKKIKIKNLKTKKYCLLSEYFISRFNTFFPKSRNNCYFPECKELVVQEKGSYKIKQLEEHNSPHLTVLYYKCILKFLCILEHQHFKE